MTDPATAQRDLLESAYRAFNARDIEGALTGMHAHVDWPNGMEGGRVHGHDGVRGYWTRQFALIRTRVEPLAFTLEPDGRVCVDVEQSILDGEGRVTSSRPVQHVYRFRDGLVDHMEIREGRTVTNG